MGLRLDFSILRLRLIMQLNELQLGHRCRVKTVASEHAVCQRLAHFGLLPGQVVELTQVAPLGDPIAIRFSGQKISLRRDEAAYVEVEALAS